MNKLVLLAPLLSATATAHDGVPHEAGLPRETVRQIHVTAAAVQRYKDFEVARREGWKRFGGDEPLMGEHWYHPDGPDYVGHDAELDFARPSNLMYTDVGGRRVLTGVTFNVRLGEGEPMPQGFAGDRDRWHAHDMLRAMQAALKDRPILRWLANGWLDANYRKKGDDRGRIAMMHLWVGVANPDGIFADHNRMVPYLKLGLPASHAGPMAAAHGVDLATRNGCRELIDGRAWIANLPKRTMRALHATCTAQADRVRASLTLPAGELNATAAGAWARWEAAWEAALTPDQHARVDAMTEHGGGHGDHVAQPAADPKAAPAHH